MATKKTSRRAWTILGIKAIRINDIRVLGPAQQKFRQAWGDYLAANLELEKLGILLISLVNGIPYVVDGQHRVYALKQNGFGDDFIDCEVVGDLNEQQMAETFLGRNDQKQVPVFEKFRVACTAQRPRELAIYRIVEKVGLHVSTKKEGGCVSAVGTLGQIYDRFGPVVLERTLAALKGGYGGDYGAFDSQVMSGVGLLFNRYGTLGANDLHAPLREFPQGIRGLLRRAHAQRDRTGNALAQCIAAAIVEMFNKKLAVRSRRRLPSWWKGA